MVERNGAPCAHEHDHTVAIVFLRGASMGAIHIHLRVAKSSQEGSRANAHHYFAIAGHFAVLLGSFHLLQRHSSRGLKQAEPGNNEVALLERYVFPEVKHGVGPVPNRSDVHCQLKVGWS